MSSDLVDQGPGPLRDFGYAWTPCALLGIYTRVPDMGIMIVWATDGTNGRDPFTTKVDTKGQLTHGHLPENNLHGGQKVALPNPTKFAGTDASAVGIDNFLYGVGDATGKHQIPKVKAGQSITFTNNDATKDSIFFQAEDGIRDLTVTGVQTCALPI